MKKGKWTILYNPGCGYIVGRVKNISEPLHSGNVEYYGSYSEDRKALIEIEERLNKEEN